MEWDGMGLVSDLEWVLSLRLGKRRLEVVKVSSVALWVALWVVQWLQG